MKLLGLWSFTTAALADNHDRTQGERGRTRRKEYSHRAGASTESPEGGTNGRRMELCAEVVPTGLQERIIRSPRIRGVHGVQSRSRKPKSPPGTPHELPGAALPLPLSLAPPSLSAQRVQRNEHGDAPQCAGHGNQARGAVLTPERARAVATRTTGQHAESGCACGSATWYLLFLCWWVLSFHLQMNKRDRWFPPRLTAAPSGSQLLLLGPAMGLPPSGCASSHSFPLRHCRGRGAAAGGEGDLAPVAVVWC